MKNKNILLCCFLTSMMVASCDSQVPSNSEVPSITTSESSKIESEAPSEAPSSEVVSEDDGELVKDDSILEPTVIDIGVGENYNISLLYSDQTAFFDILVDDDTIVAPDASDCINGLKEGTTNLKFVVNETTYDEVTINVKSAEYMNQHMKLDFPRLYGKTFTVFGDSISDISVTAYPDNRPTFWCEMLAKNFNMKMYNEAISGSTTGYCQNQVDKYGDWTTGITGTFVVNKDQTKLELKDSDYAFIYFGNNDATYESSIGEIGDINDKNYMTTESLKGAYSYLVDKIQATNPNIKIVCLSMSFSSWSAQSGRAKANQAIKEVVEAKKLKYVDIFTLWNGLTMSTYCPDGIHPQTAGYELIYQQILNS